jgi:hypothetical protein
VRPRRLRRESAEAAAMKWLIQKMVGNHPADIPPTNKCPCCEHEVAFLRLSPWEMLRTGAGRLTHHFMHPLKTSADALRMFEGMAAKLPKCVVVRCARCLEISLFCPFCFKAFLYDWLSGGIVVECPECKRKLQLRE